jgi:hypothetical protein
LSFVLPSASRAFIPSSNVTPFILKYKFVSYHSFLQSNF